ncbi:MAG: hypothetical protein MJA29_06555 [Candidatus Omnitrophica bacterium]|nr:hypothetical protein [Candidatus Omnitrophota bacterium]
MSARGMLTGYRERIERPALGGLLGIGHPCAWGVIRTQEGWQVTTPPRGGDQRVGRTIFHKARALPWVSFFTH